MEQQSEIVILEKTVEDIYNALDKNGFTYLRGQWFEFNEKGQATGGCVLGQAALNLGAYGVNDSEMAETYIDDELVAVAFDIRFKEKRTPGNPDPNAEDYDEYWDSFDELPPKLICSDEIGRAAMKAGSLTVEGQLNRFPVRSKKWEHPEIDTTRCGNTIIYWNDAETGDSTTWKPIYKLPTYEDVRKMAYTVLKPHFAKKVYLMQIDRKVKPLKVSA